MRPPSIAFPLSVIPLLLSGASARTAGGADLAADVRLLLRGTSAGERAVALRLRAELESRGHIVISAQCLTEDPSQPSDVDCGGATPRHTRQVSIGNDGPHTVVATVNAGGRSVGPLRLGQDGATQPASVGRFVFELVAWIEVTRVPADAIPFKPTSPPHFWTRDTVAAPPTGTAPPVMAAATAPIPTAAAEAPGVAMATATASPPSLSAPHRTALPAGRPPALSLGLGAALLGSLSDGGRGVRDGYGAELSLGCDWASGQVFDRWGFRVAALAAAWGPGINTSMVEVRSRPLIASAQLVGASLMGRWRFEGQLGGGVEWLFFEARRAGGGAAGMPGTEALNAETRFGFVAQAGGGAFRTLGSGRTLLVGLELRVVSAFPRQEVIIERQRFGDSALPSIVSSVSVRWGPGLSSTP